MTLPSSVPKTLRSYVVATVFSSTSAASGLHLETIMTETFSYTRTGKSNMALAEIPTLSGYRYDVEDLQSLTSIPEVQRTEYEKDDTKINVYFNPVRKRERERYFTHSIFQLGDKPVCLSLLSDLVYHVADQKPAQLSLFDYYNPEDQVTLCLCLCTHPFSAQSLILFPTEPLPLGQLSRLLDIFRGVCLCSLPSHDHLHNNRSHQCSVHLDCSFTTLGMTECVTITSSLLSLQIPQNTVRLLFVSVIDETRCFVCVHISK